MSNGAADVSREKRCEMTTWKMSPAAMYSLAARTASQYCARVMFEPIAASATARAGVRLSGERALEPALDFIQPGFGLGLRLRRVAVGVGIGDEQQASEGVIEGDNRIRLEEDRVGEVGRWFQRQPRLEEADRLVAQVADQPADEARHTGRDGGRVVGQGGAQHVQRVVARRDLLPGDAGDRVALDGAAADDEGAARVDADERVARDLFAAADAFEQERWAVAGKAKIDGDGGLQVGGEFAHEGRRVLRLRIQLFQGQHGHLRAPEIRTPFSVRRDGRRASRGATLVRPAIASVLCRQHLKEQKTPCHAKRQGASASLTLWSTTPVPASTPRRRLMLFALITVAAPARATR